MTKHTKAYLALLYICIVWGTTYLVIRVAVQLYPAFLFAAIRQLVSGLIIMGIGLFMSRKVDISIKNIIHQALVGFLLITIGNGLVSWGEKVIPSGVAALICSLMPLSSVIINMFMTREKINGAIVSGLITGFCGIALIFRDNFSDLANTSYLLGILGIFIATTSWAYGSVLNKKKASPINPIFNSGLQLLFGSIGLFAFSPFIDDYTNINFFQPEVVWSMLYLVIFGSILAYTFYMYTLKELPVGVVSLYAYVNPLVAVILGYFILNEQLTWYTAFAFVAIVAGIYLVNYGYRKKHKTQEIQDFGDNELGALPVTKLTSNQS